MKDKKSKKGLYIVIACGLVGVVIIMGLVASKLTGNDVPTSTNDKLNKVVLSEGGEASEVNMGLQFESNKTEQDSTSLLDEFESSRMDSINNANTKSISLNDASTKESSDENKNGVRQDILDRSSSNSRLSQSPLSDRNKIASSSNAYSSASRWNNGERSSRSRVSRSSGSTYSGQTTKSIPVENNNVVLEDFFSKQVKSSTLSNGSSKSVSVQAVVHNTQTIRNGDRVQLRLIEELKANGVYLSENSFIYGFARFGNNRVIIEIPKINNTDVSFSVYDSVDGFEGLYVQGTEDDKKVKGTAVDDVTRDIGGLQRIPGARAIAGLFSKRVKESKVSLLNEYLVTIK